MKGITIADFTFECFLDKIILVWIFTSNNNFLTKK